MPRTSKIDKILAGDVTTEIAEVKPKILRKSWIRDGIEALVLEMGGPLEFVREIYKKEPREFVKLVGRMLPTQLEAPKSSNLIVVDGNCIIMTGEKQKEIDINSESAAIDAEYFDVLKEKDAE